MRVPGDAVHRRRRGRFEAVEIERSLSPVFRCLTEIGALGPTLPLSLNLFAMEFDPDRTSGSGFIWHRLWSCFGRPRPTTAETLGAPTIPFRFGRARGDGIP